MRLARGACLAFAFVLSATAAWPQVPVGSEFRVNSYTTSSQYFSQAAFLSGGSFVVVWQSLGQDGSGRGIFGRRFNVQGQPLGAEFRVNTYTLGNQNRASVSGSAAGFVVAWQGLDQDGSSYGIFGQRFDASGVPLGGEFRVNEWTTGSQTGPAVAAAADGSVVIAWEGAGLGDPSEAIAGRHYAADGTPGAEFLVNTYTTSVQSRPAAAALPGGGFVVAWQSAGQDGNGFGVFARRLDAAGSPLGAELAVNTTTQSQQSAPAIGAGGPGFVVAWNGEDGGGDGVFAQRFAASGAALGGEFQVNSITTGLQYGFAAFVAADAAGNFGITWSSQPFANKDVYARFFDPGGGPRSAEMRVNTFTPAGQGLPAIAADSQGRFVVSWSSDQDGDQYGVYAQRLATVLAPSALTVDATPSGSSDGNKVLEACETVAVAPAWQNVGTLAVPATGTASAFVGPPGATYTIDDGTATYGTIAAGGTAPCTDCYAMTVSCATPRPTLHWDPTFVEQLSPLPAAQRWTLHVGDSFTDVPRASQFYRFVETLLHHAVTAGCGQGLYCPQSATTREQMAVFVLTAKEGAGYSPPACVPPNVFPDVPESSPFCRFVEELFNRGVVSGCGGGNYCPAAAVTREQMAVFVLRTLDPSLDPPACTTPVFADVPASSPFCRWIEELARRQVVSGCGGGNYCPTQPVTREQMGVFLSGTFGLTLYGP